MSEIDKDKLVRISDHLFHEIERMELNYDVLCMNQELGELRCALIDSFAIHARCISEFLWDGKKRGYEKSDVRADDFKESLEWEIPERSEFLKTWSDTMTNKRLAHLTFDRLDIKEEEAKWPIGEIYDELKVGLGRFYSWVPRRNIGPRLAARIDEAKNPSHAEVRRPINDPTTVNMAVGTSAISTAIVSSTTKDENKG